MIYNTLGQNTSREIGAFGLLHLGGISGAGVLRNLLPPPPRLPAVARGGSGVLFYQYTYVSYWFPLLFRVISCDARGFFFELATEG